MLVDKQRAYGTCSIARDDSSELCVVDNETRGHIRRDVDEQTNAIARRNIRSHRQLGRLVRLRVCVCMCTHVRDECMRE
jgi:hypothetical protein